MDSSKVFHFSALVIHYHPYIQLTGGINMNPNVRPESMERITTPELAKAFIDEQIAEIGRASCRERV